MDKDEIKRRMKEISEEQRQLKQGSLEWLALNEEYHRLIVTGVHLNRPHDPLHFWCAVCERVSLSPSPLESKLKCMYADCASQSKAARFSLALANTPLGSTWYTLRERAHSEYPVEPQPNVKYPAPKFDRSPHELVKGRFVPIKTPIKLEGVYSFPTPLEAQVHFLVLRSQDARCMHMTISAADAEALSQLHSGRIYSDQISPRPQVADTMQNLIAALGGDAQEVYIHDMRDELYSVSVTIRRDDQTDKIDFIPSDAIALAIHVKCPIFVKRAIFDAAVQEYKTWWQSINQDREP